MLAFLGFANVFAMRVNLSVAIVQMVKSPSNKQNNSITPVHISNNTGLPIEEIELCAAPEGKSQYFDEVFKNLVSNFMIARKNFIVKNLACHRGHSKTTSSENWEFLTPPSPCHTVFLRIVSTETILF